MGVVGVVHYGLWVAVRDWVLWGLLLVFTIRVSFWWLRLLSTSRGGVVVAVRGFGAVLEVVAYSVSVRWFVAGGVVTVGMTVGVSFGLLCGGCCPPCLWRVWVAVAHGG